MAINSGPLAAYTADLGPVSLTISAESDRDIFEDHDDVTIDGDVVGYGFDNASSGMPDFVAAMRYSDGGFTAHLAGALTEIRSDFAPGGCGCCRWRLDPGHHLWLRVDGWCELRGLCRRRPLPFRAPTRLVHTAISASDRRIAASNCRSAMPI